MVLTPNPSPGGPKDDGEMSRRAYKGTAKEHKRQLADDFRSFKENIRKAKAMAKLGSPKSEIAKALDIPETSMVFDMIS
jgi:hypothetical protein